MNKNIKNLTIDAYNTISKTYDKQNKGYDFWTKEFSTLLSFVKLPNSKKLLDLGCGNAGIAKLVIEKGISYTGVDISSGMLNIAKNKFPKAVFRKMDVTNLRFKDKTFDVIWASAIFLHLNHSDLVKSLQEARRVLKDKGFIFISVQNRKRGEPKEYIKVSVKEGKTIKRFFSLYTKSEFSKVLKESGFKIIKAINKVESEEGKEWVCFFCTTC